MLVLSHWAFHSTWPLSLELPGARTEVTQGETEAQSPDQRRVWERVPRDSAAARRTLPAPCRVMGGSPALGGARCAASPSAAASSRTRSRPAQRSRSLPGPLPTPRAPSETPWKVPPRHLPHPRPGPGSLPDPFAGPHAPSAGDFWKARSSAPTPPSAQATHLAVLPTPSLRPRPLPSCGHAPAPEVSPWSVPLTCHHPALEQPLPLQLSDRPVCSFLRGGGRDVQKDRA